MRGVFTAGVLQAFLDEGFAADELVGVSAGASNGVSYVSGQSGRGYRTNVDYAGDWRYASLRSYLTTGSFFGMEFLFGDMADRLDPFDFSAFAASPVAFYAGVSDVDTGRAVYFGKEHITRGLHVVRASCSIPLLSPIVEYRGGRYLDGGVAAPIPIDKALADGCERLIVVLTRPRGYQKKPQGLRPVYRTAFRHYPAFVRAMELRHLVYNHTLARLARLEAQGRAVVVAPEADLPVDRFGKDKEGLIAAYAQGRQAGTQLLSRL